MASLKRRRAGPAKWRIVLEDSVMASATNAVSMLVITAARTMDCARRVRSLMIAGSGAEKRQSVAIRDTVKALSAKAVFHQVHTATEIARTATKPDATSGTIPRKRIRMMRNRPRLDWRYQQCCDGSGGTSKGGDGMSNTATSCELRQKHSSRYEV